MSSDNIGYAYYLHTNSGSMITGVAGNRSRGYSLRCLAIE